MSANASFKKKKIHILMLYGFTWTYYFKKMYKNDLI